MVDRSYTGSPRKAGSGASSSLTRSAGMGSMSMSSRTGSEMQGLLSEFKGLYLDRLRKLEETDVTEDSSRMKMRILQSYVNDLSDQNEVLVQTVEELEKEANERVALLEKKLQNTNTTVKQYMMQSRKFEHDMKAMAIQKDRLEQHVHDVEHRFERLSEDAEGMRAENNDLHHDINTMIGVMGQARATGKWEFGDYDFRTISAHDVLGSRTSDFPSVEDRKQKHIEDLKRQLSHRDNIISKLQDDLKMVGGEHKSSLEEMERNNAVLESMKGTLAQIHDREQRQIGTVTDKDITIMKLKTDIRQEEQAHKDAMHELADKDRTIQSLQSDITDHHNTIAMKDTENGSLLQTIQLLREKQNENSLEHVKREEENRQLRADLSKAKEQHRQVTCDVSHFERRIKTLETELRQSQEQRRKTVDEIGNLQGKLRDSQSSTKDHHEVLRSELGRRDDTIQKLRNELLIKKKKVPTATLR